MLKKEFLNAIASHLNIFAWMSFARKATRAPAQSLARDNLPKTQDYKSQTALRSAPRAARAYEETWQSAAPPRRTGKPREVAVAGGSEPWQPRGLVGGAGRW